MKFRGVYLRCGDGNMTGYEIESYNRYEQEEYAKLEREWERVCKDYNRMNIFISIDFLRRIQYIDKFVYEKLMKREDVPKEVISWFWRIIKE